MNVPKALVFFSAFLRIAPSTGKVFPNEDSHGSFSFEDTSFSYMSYSGLYRIDLVTHMIAESKAIEREVTTAVHVTFPKQSNF